VVDFGTRSRLYCSQIDHLLGTCAKPKTEQQTRKHEIYFILSLDTSNIRFKQDMIYHILSSYHCIQTE